MAEAEKQLKPYSGLEHQIFCEFELFYEAIHLLLVIANAQRALFHN